MEQRGTTPDEVPPPPPRERFTAPGEGPKEFHDNWQNTRVFVTNLRCDTSGPKRRSWLSCTAITRLDSPNSPHSCNLLAPLLPLRRRYHEQRTLRRSSPLCSLVETYTPRF
jgi:hypothetical protein